MLVHELITELLQVQAQGFGNHEIRDTDGNPIVGVSMADLDLPEGNASRNVIHIESIF